MKLKIKLGANEPIRLINWWGNNVRQFPNLARYKNKKYEFVMYDPDPTGEADYVCLFSELYSYDPAWHATTFKDIDDMLDDFPHVRCQCGAVYTSFPNHHMFFCPKWSKP